MLLCFIKPIYSGPGIVTPGPGVSSKADQGAYGKTLIDVAFIASQEIV